MDKEYYMSLALEESLKCLESDDVPVGAVIVHNGEVLARAHNCKVRDNCATSHAEILAINEASRKIGNFRLNDMEIYVTKEPCLMCMGALLSARIGKIYYGVADSRFGTSELATDNKFNHKCYIEGNILEEECREVLSSFFKGLRSGNSGIRED